MVGAALVPLDQEAAFLDCTRGKYRIGHDAKAPWKPEWPQVQGSRRCTLRLVIWAAKTAIAATSKVGE